MIISICKECGDIDEVDTTGLCLVCYALENEPDQFSITDEQYEEWNKCADYIQKNKITPNLDLPF